MLEDADKLRHAQVEDLRQQLASANDHIRDLYRELARLEAQQGEDGLNMGIINVLTVIVALAALIAYAYRRKERIIASGNIYALNAPIIISPIQKNLPI